MPSAFLKQELGVRVFRICPGCGKTLPTDDFLLKSDRPVGRCKDCRQNQYRQSKRKSSERRPYIDPRCLQAYKATGSYKGIPVKDRFTRNDVDFLLESQGYRCAICKTEIRDIGITSDLGNLDHDHKTNQIRGVLCRHCNLGLGNFRDSPELMVEAIKYLMRADEREKSLAE